MLDETRVFKKLGEGYANSFLSDAFGSVAMTVCHFNPKHNGRDVCESHGTWSSCRNIDGIKPSEF